MDTVLTIKALEKAIHGKLGSHDVRIPVSRKVYVEAPLEWLQYIVPTEYIENEKK